MFLTSGAALWWWGMPKGFPFLHPRFVTNEVLPVVFVAVGATGIGACLWSRPHWLRSCHAFVAGVTYAAALTTAILFPHSTAGMLLFFVVAAAGGGALIVGALIHRFLPPASIRRWIILVPALSIGVFIPWSQRGAAAATKPANTTPPPVEHGEETRRSTSVALGTNFTVQAFSAEVVGRQGANFIRITPVLDFVSTSPDRFWTIFSRRQPRPLHPGGFHHSPGSFSADYRSEFDTHLSVALGATEQTLEIESISELPAEIHSHLNSYVDLFVTGTKTPQISFSPCPRRIEILPSDYPVGRPARFAAMKADGRFEVLEAASGEKGPFRLLAEGRLNRGEPLGMTICDGERPVFEVVLRDWSAQASTALSPTAGWGVPENAIEFTGFDSTGTAAMISVTLAGTSVGRGWDSVGHAPGGYRNRMTVRVLGAD